MQQIGKGQPTNSALRGFTDGCEQAVRVCWYGIIVNETRVSDAWDMLRGQNYFLVSSISTEASERNIADKDLQCGTYFIFEYRTVNGLIVKCRNLMLGDWILAFGMPNAVGQYHDVIYYHGKMTLRIKIKGALTPQAEITEFMFPIPHTFRESQYDWQGFAPRWRYCQLNTFNPCA